jgi:hypothetical protein
MIRMENHTKNTILDSFRHISFCSLKNFSIKGARLGRVLPVNGNGVMRFHMTIGKTHINRRQTAIVKMSVKIRGVILDAAGIF